MLAFRVCWAIILQRSSVVFPFAVLDSLLPLLRGRVPVPSSCRHPMPHTGGIGIALFAPRAWLVGTGCGFVLPCWLSLGCRVRPSAAPFGTAKVALPLRSLFGVVVVLGPLAPLPCVWVPFPSFCRDPRRRRTGGIAIAYFVWRGWMPLPLFCRVPRHRTGGIAIAQFAWRRLRA